MADRVCEGMAGSVDDDGRGERAVPRGHEHHPREAQVLLGVVEDDFLVARILQLDEFEAPLILRTTKPGNEYRDNQQREKRKQQQGRDSSSPRIGFSGYGVSPPGWGAERAIRYRAHAPQAVIIGRTIQYAVSSIAQPAASRASTAAASATIGQ